MQSMTTREKLKAKQEQKLLWSSKTSVSIGGPEAEEQKA